MTDINTHNIEKQIKIARLLFKISRDSSAVEAVRDKMKDLKIKGVKSNDKIAGVSRNLYKLSEDQLDQILREQSVSTKPSTTDIELTDLVKKLHQSGVKMYLDPLNNSVQQQQNQRQKPPSEKQKPPSEKQKPPSEKQKPPSEKQKPEEKKVLSQDTESADFKSQLSQQPLGGNQSMQTEKRQIIKHSEKAESEKHRAKGKHSMEMAHNVARSVFSDPAVRRRVPYLNTIDKLEQTKKITHEQAQKERIDTITQSSKNNRQTRAIVNRALKENLNLEMNNYFEESKGEPIEEESDFGGGGYRPDLPVQTRDEYLNRRNVSKINNLGRMGFDDDGDEFQSHGYRPTLDEIQAQLNWDKGTNLPVSNGTDLGSQTGVLTTQFDQNKQVGAKFGENAQVKDNTVEDMVAQLINISQNSKSQAVKDKTKSVISHLHKAKTQAQYAEKELKQGDYRAFNIDRSGRNDLGDASNPEAFPRGEGHQNRGMFDVIQSESYTQFVNGLLAQENLTADQRQYAESVLFDPERAINNLDFDGGSSSSSSTSSKTSRTRNSNIGSLDTVQSNVIQAILNDIKKNGGNYGADFGLNIVDKDGKKYTLSEVVSKIPDMIKEISKISGTIEENKKLKDYKKQTEVFSTAITKKEPNKFVVSQESAFRLRACC